MSTHGIIFTIVSAFLAIMGNLILRHVMNNIEFSFSLLFFIKLLLTPVFILGVIIYLASVILWLRVLSTEALSSSYPILTGIAFAGVTIGSVFFFNESISLMKFAGIVTVILGIILIARS